MTTKYLKTTGIPLYRTNGMLYCKVVDVMKMIHHEWAMHMGDKGVKDLLDRMEMRLTKNGFILPDAEKPVDFEATGLPDPDEKRVDVPGRYAVGRKKEDGWEFIAGNVGEVPLMTRKPCVAQMFTAYRDASAYADFLDEEGWQVLDMEEGMTEEERWVRELRMPFPYDLDEGFENSVPVVMKK